MNITEEMVQALVDNLNKRHWDFEKRMNSKEAQEIAEAIRIATGGSYVGENAATTCMGWFPKYDKKGRPLNCDPNTVSSWIDIEGEKYRIYKTGWTVNIYKEDNVHLTKLDLTPDYIKREPEPEWKDYTRVGLTVIDNNAQREGRVVYQDSTSYQGNATQSFDTNKCIIVWKSILDDNLLEKSVVYAKYVPEQIPTLLVSQEANKTIIDTLCNKTISDNLYGEIKANQEDGTDNKDKGSK